MFVARQEDQVIFPLMPKGVEHPAAGMAIVWYDEVIFPLMPKGVEHNHANRHARQYSSDFPSDAERR